MAYQAGTEAETKRKGDEKEKERNWKWIKKANGLTRRRWKRK